MLYIQLIDQKLSSTMTNNHGYTAASVLGRDVEEWMHKIMSTAGDELDSKRIVCLTNNAMAQILSINLKSVQKGKEEGEMECRKRGNMGRMRG